MIAVQGPKARERVHGLLSADGAARAARLGKFVGAEIDGMFVARTGYTGEDGYEIMVPEAEAVAFWNRLCAAGVKPAGLGSRDTLRLEAGMNLYGQDMDESVSPWEAALAWTIALEPADRAFIGREALVAQKSSGVPREMIGLVLDDKGVLRHGQRVITDRGDGEILSGSFSPTLGKSIAFARVPAGAAAGALAVDIRSKALPVRAVKFPFVRDGQPCAGV
jgi:aminomethyltransferase